jgi:hypothetical protein
MVSKDEAVSIDGSGTFRNLCCGGEANSCIIDGGLLTRNDPLFYFSQSLDFSLQGIAFRNFTHSGDWGALLHAKGLAIVVLKHITATSYSSEDNGNVLYLGMSSIAIIKYSVFNNNKGLNSHSSGGGIYADASSRTYLFGKSF